MKFEVGQKTCFLQSFQSGLYLWFYILMLTACFDLPDLLTYYSLFLYFFSLINSGKSGLNYLRCIYMALSSPSVRSSFLASSRVNSLFILFRFVVSLLKKLGLVFRWFLHFTVFLLAIACLLTYLLLFSVNGHSTFFEIYIHLLGNYKIFM